jgi:hypothetical protein
MQAAQPGAYVYFYTEYLHKTVLHLHDVVLNHLNSLEEYRRLLRGGNENDTQIDQIDPVEYSRVVKHNAVLKQRVLEQTGTIQKYHATVMQAERRMIELVEDIEARERETQQRRAKHNSIVTQLQLELELAKARSEESAVLLQASRDDFTKILQNNVDVVFVKDIQINTLKREVSMLKELLGDAMKESKEPIEKPVENPEKLRKLRRDNARLFIGTWLLRKHFQRKLRRAEAEFDAINWQLRQQNQELALQNQQTLDDAGREMLNNRFLREENDTLKRRVKELQKPHKLKQPKQPNEASKEAIDSLVACVAELNAELFAVKRKAAKAMQKLKARIVHRVEGLKQERRDENAWLHDMVRRYQELDQEHNINQTDLMQKLAEYRQDHENMSLRLRTMEGVYDAMKEQRKTLKDTLEQSKATSKKRESEMLVFVLSAKFLDMLCKGKDLIIKDQQRSILDLTRLLTAPGEDSEAGAYPREVQEDVKEVLERVQNDNPGMMKADEALEREVAEYRGRIEDAMKAIHQDHPHDRRILEMLEVAYALLKDANLKIAQTMLVDLTVFYNAMRNP